MTNASRELLERALRLSTTERADLAARLLESLEDEPADDPAEVEREWSQEIARRVSQVMNGADPGVPLEQVQAEVQTRLDRIRRDRPGR